jgi:hypothetical protein
MKMMRSDRLEKAVRRYEPEVLAFCDMSCTSGYDNDGSEGPELIENGVKLGVAAVQYNPNAIIFYGEGEDTCCYQFGISEDDAMQRLAAAGFNPEECEGEDEPYDEIS